VKLRWNDYVIDQKQLAAIREQGSVAPIKIGTDVTLRVNGREFPHLQPSFTITPGMGPSDFVAARITLPEGQQYALGVKSVSVDSGTATFSLATRDTALLTVIRIPGIQVLWGGVYVMLLGAFLSYRRRARLATRPVPSARAGRRSTGYDAEEKGVVRDTADPAANAPKPV